MKMFNKVVIGLFALVVAFAGTSSAEEERFIGAKTGFMMVDGDGDIDNIIPIGVVYGQSLNSVLPNLWVEGELNYGVTGGDFDVPGGSGEVTIWTLAAYGAYRHPLNAQAYLKGKLGLLYESVEMEYSGTMFGVSYSGSDSETDTGLSLGIGGGYKINDQMTAEVEYSIIEEDVDYLSVGLNFKF